MRKIIELREDTHKELKLFAVQNDCKSFDISIRRLLSINKEKKELIRENDRV